MTAPSPPKADPLPSAPPITVLEALVAVAEWQASEMPLFGLHKIAVALADEVQRLRRELMNAGVSPRAKSRKRPPPSSPPA